MLCGKTEISKINKQLSDWLIYETEAAAFEDLLESDESRIIH